MDHLPFHMFRRRGQLNPSRYPAKPFFRLDPLGIRWSQVAKSAPADVNEQSSVTGAFTPFALRADLQRQNSAGDSIDVLPG